jgi:hypothetical protein
MLEVPTKTACTGPDIQYIISMKAVNNRLIVLFNTTTSAGKQLRVS